MMNIQTKLMTLKLIAYNDKIPTNNMIKFKSPKYSYFTICNVDTQMIDRTQQQETKSNNTT